jgi:glycosyltransferase involved in cell wall biosynthesis
MIYDRIMQHHIANGKIDEDVRIVCFLITSHGPKERERLPKGFPVYLPEELLVGEEMRLKQMVYEHDLHVKNLITGRRVVAAVLYPTWVSKNDGGLNMTVEEIASGCVAAIFPSRYDPFLLTGLEAAKEGTPVIVSRVCGFSDAVREWRVKKGLMGGVMLVDNIKPSYIETLTDYAMGLETITKNYLRDRSKYMMMCGEALRLAMDMGWEEPVRRYYQILTS